MNVPAKPTTFVMSEELAYNTYAGGHSRSNRRGRVMFADGKIRTVTLGVADTFFSIPAHARVNGKYVSGFVTSDEGGFKFNEVARS
jgi:hypothetical protein